MSALYNYKNKIIPGYLCSSRVNLIGPYSHSDQDNDIKVFGGNIHILGLINAIKRHTYLLSQTGQ